MKKLLLLLLALGWALGAAAQDVPHKVEIELSAGTAPFNLATKRFNDFFYIPGDLASIYGSHAEVAGFSPCVGLRVGYRVKRWFKVGAELDWDMERWKEVRNLTDEAVGEFSRQNFYLMPTARFYFATSRIVTAYGGLGFGVRYSIVNSRNLDMDVKPVGFAWQLVPIGIRVGRRFCGFAETAIGSACLGVRGGIGYCF